MYAHYAGWGTQIIFLQGCAPRGLKPLPISKDFSPSKIDWFDGFFKIFCKLGLPVPQKWPILQIFHNFCEMGPTSKDFLDKNGTHV